MISRKYLNSHAAVSLIRMGDLYTLELKDGMYPVKTFIDTLSPFGGNWTESGDNTPRDTLIRELKEEFPDGLPEDFDKRIMPFAEYFMHVPESDTNKEYNFRVSVFELEIDKLLERTTEGSIVVVQENNFVSGNLKRVSWGYDKVISDYLQRMGLKPSIIGFPDIFVVRLDSDPETPYKERELDYYRLNPFLERLSDENVFENE